MAAKAAYTDKQDKCTSVKRRKETALVSNTKALNKYDQSSNSVCNTNANSNK